jgi:hypothetical protein
MSALPPKAAESDHPLRHQRRAEGCPVYPRKRTCMLQPNQRGRPLDGLSIFRFAPKGTAAILRRPRQGGRQWCVPVLSIVIVLGHISLPTSTAPHQTNNHQCGFVGSLSPHALKISPSYRLKPVLEKGWPMSALGHKRSLALSGPNPPESLCLHSIPPQAAAGISGQKREGPRSLSSHRNAILQSQNLIISMRVSITLPPMIGALTKL